MLITNARIITWDSPNRILEDHAVRVEEGIIDRIGPTSELQQEYSQDEILDADGQYLMPGSICAHTHFYGAFARGMAIPGRPPRDFPQILRKLWWPLDQALTLEDVRYSALTALVDAVKHGTTTLIDHHASPNAIDGSLDVIAEAVEEAGLRGVLCYEVTDRGGPEKAEAGREENLRFLERCRTEDVAGGRVAAAFGLHASMTLSDQTLAACRELAPEDAAFHVHVAEHEADEYDSLARSGMRIVERLDEFGILNERTILAHGVHMSPAEMAQVARAGSWLSHQPRSNMNNGVGAADVEGMLGLDVPVCLGNDGFSNAMWEEWKTAYLLHKVWHRDPRRMPGDAVAQIAVYNNADLARQFFPDAPLGVLVEGAHADLILVDYHPTTPMNAGNLPWHIVFGFQASMVTTTIVAGQILMKDRQLLTLDEEQIAARSRELAEQVWQRYPDFVPADDPPASIGVEEHA
ncbi:MAG: putative aminohydrolase SsnA [Anaerolineales bacterium]|nr:putative aminohydrolase SsnA [Anaerolineales bacterium]